MAILKSEFSDMSIEVVIDKIRTFTNSDNKWIYHDVKVRHKNNKMMNPEIMQNEFRGAFDTIFDLPKIIMESIKEHKIRLIETDQAVLVNLSSSRLIYFLFMMAMLVS